MGEKLTAFVYSRGKRRVGRGFSREELKAVNLTIEEALRLKIPVDERRKTKYDENVETLKKYLTRIGGKV